MKRLLDLFSGQGGATRGYQLAGFHVTGVDTQSFRNYVGDDFVQCDAIQYVLEHGREYDVIHASPPCQAHTRLKRIFLDDPDYSARHFDMILDTRAALLNIGRPYVIENIPGSPLIDPVMLCGRMFDLRLFRHRLFESSIFLFAPEHRKHDLRAPKTGRFPKEGQVYSPHGNFAGVTEVGQHIGCPWMDQTGLAQAIPPAYTRYIGEQLLAHL